MRDYEFGVYSIFFTALLLIGHDPLSNFLSSFHFIHMHLCEKLCANHNLSCRFICWAGI